MNDAERIAQAANIHVCTLYRYVREFREKGMLEKFETEIEEQKILNQVIQATLENVIDNVIGGLNKAKPKIKQLVICPNLQ